METITKNFWDEMLTLLKESDIPESDVNVVAQGMMIAADALGQEINPAWPLCLMSGRPVTTLNSK